MKELILSPVRYFIIFIIILFFISLSLLLFIYINSFSPQLSIQIVFLNYYRKIFLLSILPSAIFSVFFSIVYLQKIKTKFIYIDILTIVSASYFSFFFLYSVFINAKDIDLSSKHFYLFPKTFLKSGQKAVTFENKTDSQIDRILTADLGKTSTNNFAYFQKAQHDFKSNTISTPIENIKIQEPYYAPYIKEPKVISGIINDVSFMNDVLIINKPNYKFRDAVIISLIILTASLIYLLRLTQYPIINFFIGLTAVRMIFFLNKILYDSFFTFLKESTHFELIINYLPPVIFFSFSTLLLLLDMTTRTNKKRKILNFN